MVEFQGSTESADDLKSFETRHGKWEEDEGGEQLGPPTRTKITHIEGLGYGIVGSVLSLGYGTWLGQPAAILVLEFGFRAREKLLRYKTAKVSISFESRTVPVDKTANSDAPVICSWYPKNNRPSRQRTSDLRNNLDPSSSGQSTDHSMWPVEQFWIRGRKWSHRRKQEPHEVIWGVTEAEDSDAGISEEIRLAVIVRYSGPFRATVYVKAVIGLGLPVRNFPWSSDDPLLFDGRTPKGSPPPTSDFSAMSDQELLNYLSGLGMPPSSTQTRNQTVSGRNISSEKSAATHSINSTPRRVYRVRGIPFICRQSTFIESISAAVEVKADSIRVHSFADNPYRAEKLAVVSFEESQDEVLKPNKKMEWLISIQLSIKEHNSIERNEEAVHLLFDTHFLGFSELGMRTATPLPYIADIIAIGGLGGHAYGSFKERGGLHMWLEASLAPDLQIPTGVGVPRILIYGYDTHIENSESFQTVGDLASQLRMSLRAIRRENLCMRPIIFIGHSLGGILIKELLVLLSKGDEVDKCNFRSTRGALFFGVPNRGMDNSALISMMETQPNKDFLDSLSVDSPFLKHQAESFGELFNFPDSIIFSFYETRVSPKAIMENGKLAMKGELVVLVDKDSATHGRLWETEPRFIVAVNRNHSDMVKFERYSTDYEHVLACIRLLLEDATDIVFRRFNTCPT